MERKNKYAVRSRNSYWVHNINSQETLVFLHGAGVNHLMFKEQYRYYEGKYNLLAWDARWHGASKADFGEFNTDDIGSISQCESRSSERNKYLN